MAFDASKDRVDDDLGVRAIVITDIEDSTRLWGVNEEGMWEALTIHNHVLRSAFTDAGGDVFTTAGDSYAVAFADATLAIESCLIALDRLAAAKWGPIGPLMVRFSVHHGFTRTVDGDVVGPAVNRCARMLDKVQGGKVVASIAAKEASDWGRFRWEHMGCVPLRDFDEGLDLYEVARA